MIRNYGSPPYKIAVLHGGPGAPGGVAGFAEELSKKYGVIEPMQSADTIWGQVEELKGQLLEKDKGPFVLIGWSWGAILAYLLASKYPEMVQKIILVASAEFEPAYADEIQKIREERLTLEEREKLTALFPKIGEDPEALEQIEQIFDRSDSYDPIPGKHDTIKFDFPIYQKVMNEFATMRNSGELLRHGKNITCPVVAIHGTHDPHPHIGVEESLKKVIKDLDFHLVQKCGHTPWREKQAKDSFYGLISRALLKIEDMF